MAENGSIFLLILFVPFFTLSICKQGRNEEERRNEEKRRRAEHWTVDKSNSSGRGKRVRRKKVDRLNFLLCGEEVLCFKKGTRYPTLGTVKLTKERLSFLQKKFTDLEREEKNDFFASFFWRNANENTLHHGEQAIHKVPGQ